MTYSPILIQLGIGYKTVKGIGILYGTVKGAKMKQSKGLDWIDIMLCLMWYDILKCILGAILKAM